MLKKLLQLHLLLILLTGCQQVLLDELEDVKENDFCPGIRLESGTCPTEETKQIWDFSDSSKYNFNGNFISLDNSQVKYTNYENLDKESSYLNGEHTLSSYDSSKKSLTIKTKLDSTHATNHILANKIDHLLGYWNYENNLVSSINSSDVGTIVSGYSYSNDSIVNEKSLYFDNSSNNALTITNLNSRISDPSKGTYVAWYKPEIFAGVLFSQDYDADNFIRVQFAYSHSLRFVLKFNGSYKYCDYNIEEFALGNWLHIAAAWNTNNAKKGILYLNSKEVCSISSNGTLPTGTPSSIRLNNSAASGYVDESSYWNTNLDQEDIELLYTKQNLNYAQHNANITPHFDKSVAYYTFDGHFKDSSPKSNHLTSIFGDTFISNKSKIGSGSVSLDGDGDYISIKDFVTPQMKKTGTISLWFKNQVEDWSTQNQRFVFRTLYDTSSYDGLSMRYFDDNRIIVTINANGNRENIIVDDHSYYLPLNQWINLSFSWDLEAENKMAFFINGDKIGEVEQLSEIQGNIQTAVIGYSAQNGAKGKFDDFIMWEESLNDNEIRNIYKYQVIDYHAEYRSKVFDMGAPVDWLSLKPKTPLPYSKDLTNQSLESSHYEDLDFDFSQNLEGYWKFDEKTKGTAPTGADFQDFSKNSNHGTANTGTAFNQLGISGGAARVRSDNPNVIDLGNHISLSNTGDFTFSTWVYIDQHPTGAQYYLASKGDYHNSGWLLGLTNNACPGDYNALFINTGGNGYRACSSEGVPLHKWTNITFSYTPTTGTVKVYINAKEVAQESGLTLKSDSAYNLHLGNRSPGNWYANAKYDDTAMWSRKLSDDEIKSYYLRLANRVKFQIRSCDDIACLGEEWIGPDGTSGTYFNERQNNSSLDSDNNPLGDTKPGSALFDFNNLSITSQKNRYFQYKTVLEAQENNACSSGLCVPEVTSIEINTSSSIYKGNTSVTTKQPISYNLINSIDVLSSGQCDDLGYQVSQDGENFRYWNGSSWTNTSDDSNHSTLEQLNSNIKNYSSHYPRSKLYLKLIFNQNTSASCTVKSITVKTI